MKCILLVNKGIRSGEKLRLYLGTVIKNMFFWFRSNDFGFVGIYFNIFFKDC